MKKMNYKTLASQTLMAILCVMVFACKKNNDELKVFYTF